MGKGRIRISFARLRDALNLPEDTEIDTVAMTQEYAEIRIFVRHPGIVPEYECDGGIIEDIYPKFRKEYPEQQPVVKFVGWK